jgi:hypothetical protein
MTPVQTFTDEYLEQCRRMTPDQVIRFLEDFRMLQSSRPARSKLISLKVSHQGRGRWGLESAKNLLTFPLVDAHNAVY